MTVSTTTTYNEATGAGGVKTFYFTFRCDDSSWVVVYLDDVPQGAGYTVALNADQSTSPGGSVTFATAPDGLDVLIQRETAITQETNYTAYDAFPAETHELALDKLTLVAQEVARTASDARAEEAAARLAGDAALQVNITAEAASRLSGDQAEALVRAAADAAIIASGAEPANVGLAPVIATAPGSTTPRTVAARFGDTINLKDAGCVCDGVTNDYAALAALVTALGSTHITVVVPDRCHTHTAVTFHPNTSIRFTGRGCFTGSVVVYSGMGIYSAGGIFGGQVGSHAPWTFHNYRSNAAPGNDQYLNDVLAWAYNADPANGSAQFSTDHPQWIEQIETHFGGSVMPLGFEKHWTWVSVDRLTTYRPMNFGVNFATNEATLRWLVAGWSLWHHTSGFPALRVVTTPGSELFAWEPAPLVGFNCDKDGNVNASRVVTAGLAVSTRQYLTTGVNVSYSASITPNCQLGTIFYIGVTDANAFTINLPSNQAESEGQIITFFVMNQTAGALGTATWNGGYIMAPWVQPDAGKSRAITFHLYGGAWRELNRSAGTIGW